MSSKIIAGTTSGTALNMSADTSGILEIQTGSTPTTAITVDASQNVGIGNSTPVNYGKLAVAGTIVSSTSSYATAINGATLGYYTSGSYPISYIQMPPSGGFQVWDSGTAPKLVLDSTGNLIVGTTSANGSIIRGNGGASGSDCVYFTHPSATAPYGIEMDFSAAAPNNTSNYFWYSGDTSNAKAILYSNGSWQVRANSYGGISDIKLKQDIVDASSQWNDVKAVKVRKYRYKDEVAQDPNYPAHLGVVAQEIEKTSPNLVFESPDFEKDAEGNRVDLGTTTKAVKYSILYMKAFKALQEAMERIEIIEAKVDAQAAEIQALKGVA